MSPLCVLALAALCAAGTRAVKVEQTELSITKVPGKTVRMSCVVSGVTFSDAFIHWYQQKPGQGLERLLSILSESDIFYEVGVDKNRFEVDKKAKFSTSTLTIHRVEIGDAATYYCGCWDTTAWIKYFGGGTKLVVTGGTVTPKAPEPIKFFPSSLEQEKQNTETYICLLKDFYPEIIRMHWKEEGSDKILESQQSEPLQVKDKYWQLSWLTVNKSSPGKIYRLIYKHEKTGRIAKEELFTAPVSVPTTTSTKASTTVETSVPTTTSTEASTTVETSVPTTTSTKTSTTVETSVPTTTSTEASTTVETAVPTTISTERSTSFETSVATIISTERSVTFKTLRSTPPTAREACTTGPVKQVFQSVNTTAYYTYTILLLKSTTYCIFMLFLIYKRNMASGNWRELSSSHLWRKV
uniref:Ig-like domain-containing protein n=1 Tax=Ornithorhynchus anatinus TaxID=9258 RepID=A0A6I8NL30_ORNAN